MMNSQKSALRVSLIAVVATFLLTPTAEAGFKTRMFWLAVGQIKKVGGAVKKGSVELKHAPPHRSLISNETANRRLDLRMPEKALRSFVGWLSIQLMADELMGDQSALWHALVGDQSAPWHAGPGDCAWSREGAATADEPPEMAASRMVDTVRTAPLGSATF